MQTQGCPHAVAARTRGAGVGPGGAFQAHRSPCAREPARPVPHPQSRQSCWSRINAMCVPCDAGPQPSPRAVPSTDTRYNATQILPLRRLSYIKKWFNTGRACSSQILSGICRAAAVRWIFLNAAPPPLPPSPSLGTQVDERSDLHDGNTS
jgi:hypothetical protein